MNSSPPCGRSPSRCLVAALAVTLAVAALPAQEEPGPEARKKRPKIGLVLSGGGARGCAHAGVIKVLEELRIPVDYISANSMGSIVGATYAYGASPAEMIRTLVEMDWAYILQDKPRRADLSFRRKEDDRNFLLDVDIGFRDWKVVLPKGLIQGQNLDIVLRGLVPESYKLHDFSKLPIPFHAVAADIANGEEVVLSKGDLAIAMRASMSVPGAFRPVTIDGRELVDGMIVNNLPIDVVRKMGAEVVIAIDIGTPLMKPEEIGSLLGVTGQMIGILMQRNVDKQIATLTDKDIYLQPNLGDISSSGFGRASESIAIGEKAARGIADKLKKFSVSEEEWQKFLKRQRRPGWPKWQPPVIQGIRITNDSRLSNGVIRANLTVKPGQVLDMKRLKSDLERIYGIADFELVRYRLEEREDGTYLRIRAEEKSWGPGYIKFGLSLVDNLDGDNDYDIGVQYTWRPVNALGAELRTSFSVGQVLGMSAEFYQPLDEGQRWFVSPVVRYRERPTNVFQGRTQIAEVEVDDWLFGFEWGRQLSNWGEIRGGISRQVGRVDPNIGTIPGGRFSFDDAGMSVSFLYDTLDDPNFPGSGATANLSYFWSMPGIGADERYEFFQAGFGYAHTWDRTTAIVFGNYSKATSGTRPVWRLSRIGGFLNLSGFQQGELTGQHSMVGALSIYQQISGVRHVSFGMPVYIGGSIETGNVWDDSDDIGDDLILAGSIWAGIDTPLGPLYLGYGLAEGNDHDSVYLFLGNTFSRNPNRR